MLTTRKEQTKRLEGIINKEISINRGVVVGNIIIELILYGIVIMGAIVNNDPTALSLLVFPCSFVLIPSFFCLPLWIKNKKAKRNLIANNYSYYYLPIDKITPNGGRGANHMDAWYTFKDEQYITMCWDYRARRVHVFDCNGFIISDIEEEKDLAM